MYSAAKNAVFFQRLKNVSVAARNFLDEVERLCDLYDSEVSPGGNEWGIGGTPHADFVSVPELATTSEAATLLLYCRALKKMHDGEIADANSQLVNHDAILTPFLADHSAL